MVDLFVPHRSRRRLLAVVLLALMVAALGVTAQQGDLPIQEEKATECWRCHNAVDRGNGRLLSLFDVVPASPSVEVQAVPSPFSAHLHNAWAHDMPYHAVTLDLEDAPSLAFTSDRLPLEGSVEGAFDPASDPTAATGSNGSAFYETHVLHVPAPATSLVLTLVPTGEPPATYALLLYPGGNTSVAPAVRREAAAPGEEIAFEADSKELARLGSGNWSLVVEWRPVDGPGGPTELLATPSYRLDHAIAFDVEGRQQTLSSRDPIASGGFVPLTWTLRATAPPGPDERIRIIAEATVHFSHKPSSNAEDQAQVIKRWDARVAGNDAATILFDTPPPRPAGPTAVGISMGRIGEIVGYTTAFLLVASIVSGGMFGRSSRRRLNRLFAGAKRRVSFHNLLSYGLLLAGLAHTVLFVVEAAYHWSLGLLWGGLALVGMLGLGVTGALQVPMIRRWHFAAWRWTHWSLAVATLICTAAHMLLDGSNFAPVQEALGWNNPLDPGMP